MPGRSPKSKEVKVTRTNKKTVFLKFGGIMKNRSRNFFAEKHLAFEDELDDDESGPLIPDKSPSLYLERRNATIRKIRKGVDQLKKFLGNSTIMPDNSSNTVIMVYKNIENLLMAQLAEQIVKDCSQVRGKKTKVTTKFSGPWICNASLSGGIRYADSITLDAELVDEDQNKQVYEVTHCHGT